VIAAKAVCFGEDLKPEFKVYIQHVLDNTKACDDEFKKLGAAVSGTENHLLLLNVLKSFGLTGKDAQLKLEAIGITTNKNMLHGDTLKPAETSGLRIGFAAPSSRGCTVNDARRIADLIVQVLKDPTPDNDGYHQAVLAITSKWQNVMDLVF